MTKTLGCADAGCGACFTELGRCASRRRTGRRRTRRPRIRLKARVRTRVRLKVMSSNAGSIAASSASPSSSASRNGLAASRLGGQFDAGPNAKLVENMGEVGLDRPRRDYRVARRSAGWCDRRAASRPVRLGAGEDRPSEDRPPDGFGCVFDNVGGISQPLGRARFRVAGQRASAATLRLDGRRGGCRCASSRRRLNLL